MNVGEFVDSLKRIKSDCPLTFKFIEDGNQKTIEAAKIEITDDGMVIHGHVVMAIYGLMSEQEEFIIQTVVKNIRDKGELWNLFQGL